MILKILYYTIQQIINFKPQFLLSDINFLILYHLIILFDSMQLLHLLANLQSFIIVLSNICHNNNKIAEYFSLSDIYIRRDGAFCKIYKDL